MRSSSDGGKRGVFLLHGERHESLRRGVSKSLLKVKQEKKKNYPEKEGGEKNELPLRSGAPGPHNSLIKKKKKRGTVDKGENKSEG